MELFFSLSLPRESVSVPTGRHLFGSSLRNLGVTEGCVRDLELIVTEACSNVLKHAQVGSAEYEVSMRVDSHWARISVAAAGRRFEGSPPHAALNSESGRGLQLMRELADDVRFEADSEGRSSVHVVKRLELEESSILARPGPHLDEDRNRAHN
jgi:serine/threonine-protein kinase RsbW